MGNCVGHSIQKNKNKIPRKTKNKQDNSEYFERTSNIEEQETNKEKLNPGITTVKTNNKNGNQDSERQNSSIFKDTRRVTESAEDVGILIPGH